MFVYILASSGSTLYVGVTSNLLRRLAEHRAGIGGGFTRKYRTHRLVHAESFDTARDAILREKQIKGWKRERKIALIESANPGWEDLAHGCFPRPDPSLR
jgi:putative endonuclease